MRAFFYLGPTLGLLVILTAVTIVFLTLRGPGLDRESHAFVDCAVPAITSTWDEQSLISRATPELLGDNRQQLDAQFTRYKQLGRLRDYDGAIGDSDFAVTPRGLKVTGHYRASAKFDSGPADLKVSLVKRSGDWLIDDFRVESPLLLGDSAPDAATRASSTTGGDVDVNAYGDGVVGFERWGKATLSAWAFRYQSAQEVWIAMSDAYGPYPTEGLAQRAGVKYLQFVNDTDKVRIVLFRTNEKGAEATVDRPG